MKAAGERSDVATMDGLAWACFQAGRLEDAKAASDRARRTGTSDRRILYHAAAIEQALGNDEDARRFVSRALDRNPRFDLVAAPAAVALAREVGVSCLTYVGRVFRPGAVDAASEDAAYECP
jgi:tetratricopeptide (TPR) repeat protein